LIRLVTGPLGTGKSYYMVKTGVEALEMGKMLVTNFDMQPDWAERVARRRRIRPNGPRARAYRDSLERRYLRVESLEELMQLRLRREKPFVKEKKGKVLKGPDGEPVLKEGQCVVLLDEAHRWMNARSWSKEGREAILEYFALARKRGMVVYLGSQRAENLDVQVRELFEDHIQLENLKYSARLMGLRVIPFNWFLAAWSNHGWPNRYVKEERYLLKWYRHLYDTMDTGSFSEVADRGDGGQLLLPHREDDRREASGPPGCRGRAPPSPDGPHDRDGRPGLGQAQQPPCPSLAR